MREYEQKEETEIDGVEELSQLNLRATYTYADYLTWKFKERVELIKGQLFQMSPAPSRMHQTISRQLSLHLFTYFNRHSCEAFAAPFDVRLPKEGREPATIYSVVQPDLCVVCDASKLDERGCLGAPDWVIEIRSPGNSELEMGLKKELYEEAGVKEYWVVEMTERILYPFIRSDAGIFLALPIVNETMSCSPTLFPDLEISLADIFFKSES